MTNIDAQAGSSYWQHLLTVGPQPARSLIVSDAWLSQVNCVVRTLQTISQELRGMGDTVEVVGPDRFFTLPCPAYPDIRLAVLPARRLNGIIEDFAPEALHIATEGPLGLSVRAWARRRGCAFTTAFHTRFPEYIRARIGIPEAWLYAWLQRFHNAGQSMMVATASLRAELAERGFREIREWSRGVDLAQFRPVPAVEWNLPRPVFTYVGRVAVEKNIGAFLDLDLPGSKVVVGDGPQFAVLRRRYPGVHFSSARFGPKLAAAYARGDVLVFPSVTDTFGRALLEALACGTPVAAYDVTGPRDVLASATGCVGAVGPDPPASVWHYRHVAR